MEESRSGAAVMTSHLFEGLVIHKAGSILGYVKLPFLKVLAEFPTSQRCY